MQALLLRTLAWLSGDSGTSAAPARALIAPRDTTTSCRLPSSVTQTSVRANELQHAKRATLWRSSLTRQRPLRAQGPCGGEGKRQLLRLDRAHQAGLTGNEDGQDQLQRCSGRIAPPQRRVCQHNIHFAPHVGSNCQVRHERAALSLMRVWQSVYHVS